MSLQCKVNVIISVDFLHLSYIHNTYGDSQVMHIQQDVEEEAWFEQSYDLVQQYHPSHQRHQHQQLI